MPVKIALIDDNPKLLRSLSQNLAFFSEVKLIFMANNGLDLLTKLPQNPLPEVLLMDIEMPEMNGIQASFEINQRYNGQIKIIMLTVLDQEDKIFAAIQAGASGYLLKDEKPAKIVNAIEEVIQGGVPMSASVAQKTLTLLRNQTSQPQSASELSLSPEVFDLTAREIEILQAIAAGLSYKQIAEKLFISDKTVKKHTENVYAKLHVHSKYEAIKLAERNKWVK
ncbi:MAG: response regulator transcription factor [Microscillaceae bacterium]|nr:response regulator transcription factor [Microscillaceae bacterium]